jgi:hypothetical protein
MLLLLLCTAAAAVTVSAALSQCWHDTVLQVTILLTLEPLALLDIPLPPTQLLNSTEATAEFF